VHPDRRRVRRGAETGGDRLFANDGRFVGWKDWPLEVHTRSGKPWEPRWVRIEGFDYWLDLQGGQKTGFYLDQRYQHGVVANIVVAPGSWTRFCNQGAFALHAARAGATESARSRQRGGCDCRGAAERSAQRRDAEFTVANVFDWFKAPDRNVEPLWSHRAGSAAVCEVEECA
jgi:23S rRNA (cytosine1962-C5)-methyltransferase